MKLFVNDKEVEVQDGCPVSFLLESIALSGQGIAVGVNGKIVPKADWDTFSLNENDRLVVIRAACGG